MLETRRSCFWFLLSSTTFSLSFLPSCPGAPPGQSGTTCGSSATARPGKSNRAKNSLANVMSSISSGKRLGVSGSMLGEHQETGRSMVAGAKFSL